MNKDTGNNLKNFSPGLISTKNLRFRTKAIGLLVHLTRVTSTNRVRKHHVWDGIGTGVPDRQNRDLKLAAWQSLIWITTPLEYQQISIEPIYRCVQF